MSTKFIFLQTNYHYNNKIGSYNLQGIKPNIYNQ